MKADRFERPSPGLPTAVRFPTVDRSLLGNGLAVWSIRHAIVPVFGATIVLPHGTSEDPADLPGLASLTGDLLDEGAGDRDAIEVAEAFAQMGTHVDVEVGPDATSISVTALARFFEPALALVADVLMRPRLAPNDFNRVRDLRLNRLRQLSRSAATMADRAFVSAVFGAHGYGHGALGTTAGVQAITVDHAREFWRAIYRPAGATLIVVGDLARADVERIATTVFGAWHGTPVREQVSTAPAAATGDAVLLVDKPGAPQSEIRVGQLGPSRHTSDYHTLLLLNAVVGGQFTSRINRRLREEKGVTYGARSAFDFRRVAGSFSCDSSVQADATAEAVADMLREIDTVRREVIPADELERARASLTRGYVRHFETAGQVTRAASQLALYELDDRTFDRFVPDVEAVTASAICRAAASHLHPEAAVIVVVGDAERLAPSLGSIGRPVVRVVPDF